MPSGYTAPIKDGVSFREFTLSCARAFGALVHMRDSPMTEPINLPTLSTYHKKALARDARELARVERMPLGRAIKRAKRRAAEEFQAALDEHKACSAKDAKLRYQYEAMLKHVRAWKPPSRKHGGLKKFMISQIRESMQFDLLDSKNPEQRTWTEYLVQEHEGLERSVQYHRTEWAKERKRIADRRLWIRQLMRSVQVATPKK